MFKWTPYKNKRHNGVHIAFGISGMKCLHDSETLVQMM